MLDPREIQYPIKVCPWCYQTPSFDFALDDDTWLLKIKCRNEICKVNPQSKYVPVRKTQKSEYPKLRQKIELCFMNWNDSLGTKAKDAFNIDYPKILAHGRRSVK